MMAPLSLPAPHQEKKERARGSSRTRGRVPIQQRRGVGVSPELVRRGLDFVRQLGDELRKHKDPLGRLVSLEMGKILSEGLGEVQEMIDICDFAVGLSRQLYGLTMHSERPSHRMYEQWHPLGVIGIISAFNFPVAVWAWNAFIGAVAGNVCVWKPSPKTPLSAIAVQKICNAALADAGMPPIFQLFIDKGNTLAQRFVDDRRVALVSFTGSCAIGRKVGQAVAKRMGKSLLELGARTGNAWPLQKTAVMNGLFADRPLEDGQRVKVAVAESYRPVAATP